MTSKDAEESVDSIIREGTDEEDKKKIQQVLNRSIKKGTGIVGGGIKIFEPYLFHEDEPRRICVYTIPFLLDDRCPVLRELVDMLWATVDASKDLNKIDRGFINQTQRLLDDFNDVCQISASYIDLYEAIKEFTEESAHPEDKEKARVNMKSVIDRIKQKWEEYKKPVVSRNLTAMNLLLKLYRCIDSEEYKTSTVPSKFHNVFIMAYDTGADNRYFIAKWFYGTRPILKTCVAFTSIDGLDRSTTYNEMVFEPEYKYLHGKIKEEITRFLSFIPERRISSQIAEMSDRIAEVTVRVEKIEVTVQELKNMRQEQGKLHDFMGNLKEMSTYIHKMGTESTIDNEEGKRILQTIDDVMSHFREDEESLKSSNLDDEAKRMRKHMVQMKKMIAEHAKAINELIYCRDKTIDVQKAIVSAREEWERRAIEIDNFANSLKRDEERLEAISEDATKKFIMEQYGSSSSFGKWCLRQAFPFIKELKLE